MVKYYGKTPAKGEQPDARASASAFRAASLSKPVITSDEDKALLFQQTPKTIPEVERESAFPPRAQEGQQDRPEDRFHEMMSRTKPTPAETPEPSHNQQKHDKEPSVDWDAGKAAYQSLPAFIFKEKPERKGFLKGEDLYDGAKTDLERIDLLSEKLSRCQRLQRLLLVAVMFATVVDVLLLVLK